MPSNNIENFLATQSQIAFQLNVSTKKALKHTVHRHHVRLLQKNRPIASIPGPPKKDLKRDGLICLEPRHDPPMRAMENTGPDSQPANQKKIQQTTAQRANFDGKIAITANGDISKMYTALDHGSVIAAVSSGSLTGRLLLSTPWGVGCGVFIPTIATSQERLYRSHISAA